MTKDEALTRALEALEWSSEYLEVMGANLFPESEKAKPGSTIWHVHKAIAAIKEALSDTSTKHIDETEEKRQEIVASDNLNSHQPVAYAIFRNGEIDWDADYTFSDEPFGAQLDDEECRPLYTHPGKDWEAIAAEQAMTIAMMKVAQAPVAWGDLLGAVARGWCSEANKKKVMDSDLTVAIAKEVQAVYNRPPQREWVGLTDEDINAMAQQDGLSPHKAPEWLYEQCLAIEEKLKEKNT